MPKTIYSSAEQMAALVDLRTVVGTIQQQLTANHQEQAAMASNIEILKGKVDALTADVEAQTTVTDSAVTLINGLLAQNVAFAQQIKDLIAAGGTPEQFKEVADAMDANNAKMDASREKLASALVTPPTA